MPKKLPKRAVIFANGVLNHPRETRARIQPNDLLIAADGGYHHCLKMGLTPAVLIGDFDSLDNVDLDALQTSGTIIIHHPARKDLTDLELAIRHAQELGVEDILIIAALGARWDQTLANLLLPAHAELKNVTIRMLDGPQEVTLLRGGGYSRVEIRGKPGDTVSLIPLGEDASGITTRGLEYPLQNDCLVFGATRGISNILLGETAHIELKQGLLMCVVIHTQ